KEMRREDEVRVGAPRLERRTHLAEVPMCVSDGVRAIVFAHLTEQQLALRRVACAGDAARGVRDDRPVRRRETTLDERRQCNENRRWIAAWIRDQLSVGYERTVELRETVGDALASVARPEVRRQIDSTRTCRTRAPDPILRGAMWQ